MLTRLACAGWTTVGHGDRWYAARVTALAAPSALPRGLLLGAADGVVLVVAGAAVVVAGHGASAPGVLDAGRTLRVKALRVWARFGAAANLHITQDGRRVVLQGTYDKVFSPR